jgi:hypothetical protein
MILDFTLRTLQEGDGLTNEGALKKLKSLYVTVLLTIPIS